MEETQIKSDEALLQEIRDLVVEPGGLVRHCEIRRLASLPSNGDLNACYEGHCLTWVLNNNQIEIWLAGFRLKVRVEKRVGDQRYNTYYEESDLANHILTRTQIALNQVKRALRELQNEVTRTLPYPWDTDSGAWIPIHRCVDWLVTGRTYLVSSRFWAQEPVVCQQAWPWHYDASQLVRPVGSGPDEQ